MKKVSIWDKRIRTQFWGYFSVISGIISFVFLFDFLPDEYKKYNLYIGAICLFILIVIYISIWIWANRLKKIKINIDGSSVIIKEGDLFEEEGYKAIGFNEYFDTQVDNKIISEHSLNGIFIKRICSNNTEELDKYITNQCNTDDIIEKDVERKRGGKKIKYKLSSIVVYDEYLLTAFSKFDDENRAYLTMPEYIEFLINFWDRVNRIYAQKSVSVPVFGSGITRIKEHKNITDEDLLKIMLWTFKLSEYRFKYPAKLTIIVHKDKIDEVNLLDIESIKKGL
ncbi:hypothetical protein EZS27_027616 [termite gut metagenome]|uniref:Thoeris protein ThsA Macro domain-containing protein n=1 Tax=termite gut metagenome TaxID=433724 RepID=A0A5J4QP41_9ZZZZ